jgi:hypothetical protein
MDLGIFDLGVIPDTGLLYGRSDMIYPCGELRPPIFFVIPRLGGCVIIQEHKACHSGLDPESSLF